MFGIQRDEFRAPERAGEPQQQKRAVPQTFQRFRLHGIHHAFDLFIDGWRLLRGRSLPLAADPPQDFGDLERIVRRGEFGANVHETDRGEPTAQGRGRAAKFGFRCQEQRDRVRDRGQWVELHCPAPPLEDLPIRFVGAPSGGRATRFGVPRGRIEGFLE